MSPAPAAAQVRAILERADRAVPAEYAERRDGWRLRHDHSAAWWVSSVLPHEAPGDLPSTIAQVERFYHQRGAPARFQISPAVRPAHLDGVLAERGYHREAQVSVRTAAATAVLHRSPATSLAVRVHDQPASAWLAAWRALHAPAGDPGPELKLLDRVDQPSGYGYALAGEEVIAVGRAVADTGWAGVFGMATMPHARGRGAARAVLAGLARWAAGRSYPHLYLQVEIDNAAAVRLYTSAGFTELCQYHYRTGPR